MNGHLWKGRKEEKRHVRDLSQVKIKPSEVHRGCQQVRSG